MQDFIKLYVLNPDYVFMFGKYGMVCDEKNIINRETETKSSQLNINNVICRRKSFEGGFLEKDGETALPVFASFNGLNM